MAQTIGDTRECMAQDCWNKAVEIADSLKSEVKPFYILFTAKVDPGLSGADAWGKRVSGGIRQAFRVCYKRPPFVLGMLVWFVNNPLGIFELVPDLSSPPDVPLNPDLLSDRSEDQFTSVMNKAQKMNKFIPLVS